MERLLDLLLVVGEFLWGRDAAVEGVFIPLMIAMEIICMRLLCSGLAASVLCRLVTRARGRLTPAARSWLWGLCFAALFIPFEQALTTFLQYRLALMPISEHMHPKVFQLCSKGQQFVIRLWFGGFLFFAAKTYIERVKTIRLVKAGKIPGCAAYFYRFRSRIYLPPEFDTVYGPAEQEMLLAHERQHVKQRDPFLYWFLQGVQCVYWFCPSFHRAVRLFRRDRELLCDERLLHNYSPKEYGSLLIKEARKMSLSPHVPAGLVSATGNLTERIEAFTISLPYGKKAAAAVLCVVLTALAVGSAGFVEPAYHVLDPARIIVTFRYDDDYTTTLWTDQDQENMRQYITPGPDSVSFDQEKMYDYAIAAGIRPEQRLYVAVITGERPVLFNGYGAGGVLVFEIEKLKTETLTIPLVDEELDNPILDWITRYL